MRVETPVTIWERVPSSIPAIFVRINGGEGSVYMLGENLLAKKLFLQTGPEQRAEYVLMIIRSGQSCHFYGEPSVRYFQARSLLDVGMTPSLDNNLSICMELCAVDSL